MNFHSLEDYAIETNCKFSDLIKIVTEQHFPVFIMSNNWYAHVWKKYKSNEQGLNEENSTITLEDWEQETTSINPIHLSNNFIELKTSNLHAYLLNESAIVGKFEAGDLIKGNEDYYYEFRLCNSEDFSKSLEIDLKKHKLFVKSYSLTKIEKMLHEKSNQITNVLPDNERKKLLKIIGSLALAISHKSNNLQIKGKPNVNQISNKILESFDELSSISSFEPKNLSDTTLRGIIKMGLDELLNN